MSKTAPAATVEFAAVEFIDDEWWRTWRSTLELARDAAQGRIAVALIARLSAFGRLDCPGIFKSPLDEAAWIMQHFWGTTLWKNRPKFAVDKLPEMPTEEPQRTAEALRRALPSLLKLQRFEARAVARRD